MKIGMVIVEKDLKEIIARYFKLDVEGITNFDMTDKNIMLNYDDDRATADNSDFKKATPKLKHS